MGLPQSHLPHPPKMNPAGTFRIAAATAGVLVMYSFVNVLVPPEHQQGPAFNTAAGAPGPQASRLPQPPPPPALLHLGSQPARDPSAGLQDRVSHPESPTTDLSHLGSLGVVPADDFLTIVRKAGSNVAGWNLPDDKWPAGPGDWNRYHTVRVAPAVHGGLLPESLDESWRGTEPRDSDASPADAIGGLYYFYDDIANHSVYMMQASLAVVEPHVRQVSMYVSPEKKTFGWSYPVKTTFIINSILANIGKVIVFLDTDMVFYRPWVNRVVEKMRDSDIVFQGVDTYDQKIPKEFTKMRKSISMAVMAVKCSENTAKFFKSILSKITCNGRWVKGMIDQEELISSLSNAARTFRIRWHVFDRYFWSPAMSRSRCQMPPQPVMCHPDKKKGGQGGQWMSWHRKTEWKFHHIMSQHCMGHRLIPLKDQGGWWRPDSLTTGISTAVVPHGAGRGVAGAEKISPKASYYIYTEFYPDEWSRFMLQLTLRRVLKAQEAQGVPLRFSYASQHLNGSISARHVAEVLSGKPVGSVTLFSVSTLLFLSGRFDSALAQGFAGIVPKEGSRLKIGRAGQSFFIIELLREASGEQGVQALEAEVRGSLRRAESELPKDLFYVTGGGGGGSGASPAATGSAAVCIGESLRGFASPKFESAKNGLFGYTTLDEQYFYMLAYLQCGRPYSDPFHTLDHWTSPGEPVDSCHGHAPRRALHR